MPGLVSSLDVDQNEILAFQLMYRRRDLTRNIAVLGPGDPLDVNPFESYCSADAVDEACGRNNAA